MEVRLQNISKRFSYQYILRDINVNLQSGSYIGIGGSNGSGKSTLLALITGYLSMSEGSIDYILNKGIVPRADVYKHITIAAPYVDITTEFNLREIVEMHQRFRPFFKPLSCNEFLNLMEVDYNPEKLLKTYSSGMLQRVKLSLAILSISEILLLDEPLSFLDEETGIWFWNLLKRGSSDRMVIIASNDPSALSKCPVRYDIQDRRLIKIS